MHPGMRECRLPFLGTVTLASDLVSEIIAWNISPISFVVEISKLVCGCLFRWWSVMYHFGSL